MRFNLLQSTIGFASMSLCISANAQFVAPDAYGWQRGDNDSTWAEWDDFTSAVSPNTPDMGQFPDPLPAGWSEPTVTCLTASAIVTSTGNIYSFSDPTEFEIIFPTYDIAGSSTSVLMQTRTFGNEINPASVLCDGTVPAEVVELNRVDIGQGFLVETLWRFEVDTQPDHMIEFESIESSMSFAAVAIDTFTSGMECLADVNGDGSVTPTDFTAWIAAFNTSAPGCDQNGDGQCTATDFTAWITNFNNGC